MPENCDNDDDDLIVSMYVAGEIPATLGELTGLIELQLGSNKLRGEMPRFIACACLCLLVFSLIYLRGRVC